MTTLLVLADIVVPPPTPPPAPAPPLHAWMPPGVLPYVALAIVAVGVLWFLRKSRATEPRVVPRANRS